MKIKRIPHILAENQKTEIPVNMVFVDTETSIEKHFSEDTAVGWDSQSHKLRLGWAKFLYRKGDKFGSDKWHYFEDSNNFWDWLDSLMFDNSRFYLFCHNWNFDFNILESWKNLTRLGYELNDNWILDSSRVILTFSRKNEKGKVIRTIKFIDTGNYIKMPLREIGKCVGIAKGEIANFETATNEELKPYCKTDVEILSSFVVGLLKFILEKDLGNFKPTSAGLAFSAFKHRFNKHNIFIHDNKDAIELERLSYRGGRTETFFIGEVKEPLYKLDVNSQYPFVMKTNKYPVKLESHYKNPPIADLKYYLDKGYLVIADCIFSLDENAIGIKLYDKLIFPKYPNMHQALTTPEIEYILKHGTIKYIFSMNVYSGEYIFNDYVDFFYPLKVVYGKNPLYKTLVKLFLNSLYGKFGQRGRENILINNDFKPPEDSPFMERTTVFEGKDLKTYTRINNKVYLLDESAQEGTDSFVAIASHTTGYARMFLYILLLIANNNGTENNVYYIDTDSLFTNLRGYELLKQAGYINEEELGKLKNEGIIHNVKLFGAKDYEYSTENDLKVQKIKGIRTNNPETILTKEGVYEQTQFSKILSMAKEGINDKVIISRVQKKLSRKYSKAEKGTEKWLKPYSKIPDKKVFI